jgi:hypothetical protein
MTTKPKENPIEIQKDNSLAIVSLVLGVSALNGMGFLTGIPAIVIGIIALKNKKPGRGLSIAGLATGIVGTVVSLIVLAFIIFLAINANTPTDRNDYRDHTTMRRGQPS